MQTKYLCVLIHIRFEDEVSTVKSVKVRKNPSSIFTDHSKALLHLLIVLL